MTFLPSLTPYPGRDRGSPFQTPCVGVRAVKPLYLLAERALPTSLMQPVGSANAGCPVTMAAARNRADQGQVYIASPTGNRLQATFERQYGARYKRTINP